MILTIGPMMRGVWRPIIASSLGWPLRVSLDRMNLEQVRRHTSLSAKWNIDKAQSLRFPSSNLLNQTYVSETCVFTKRVLTTRALKSQIT